MRARSEGWVLPDGGVMRTEDVRGKRMRRDLGETGVDASRVVDGQGRALTDGLLVRRARQRGRTESINNRW